MKYLGTISDPKDLTNKNYVDTEIGGVETSLNSHTGNTSNPHSVTKTQVGLGNVDNVKQWSASNHPTTLSGYGITDALPSTTVIPTKTSELENDSGFVTSSEIPDLSTAIYGADVSTVEATIPLNADTLEGHSASYFATASSVAGLATVATTGSYASLIDTPADNQLRAIYIGTSDPSSSLGSNGDIYIKYSS